MFRALNPEKIIQTTTRLRQRIDERFPGASLGQVAAELIALAGVARERIDQLARPNWVLRLASALLIIIGLAGVTYLSLALADKRATEELAAILEGADAAVSLLVVIGVSLLFLATLEARWKRARALRYLHELRSILHIIDMHQLTKDPSVLSQHSTETRSSPKRALTPFEMIRYLDYCSELLSLTAKVAALYAQCSRDAVVVGAVDAIAQLTTNLSEKIWQKVTLVFESGTTPMTEVNGIDRSVAMPP